MKRQLRPVDRQDRMIFLEILRSIEIDYCQQFVVDEGKNYLLDRMSDAIEEEDLCHVVELLSVFLQRKARQSLLRNLGTDLNPLNKN